MSGTLILNACMHVHVAFVLLNVRNGIVFLRVNALGYLHRKVISVETVL